MSLIRFVFCANDYDDTHWTLDEREWLDFHGIESQHMPCGCDDGELEVSRAYREWCEWFRRRDGVRMYCSRCGDLHECRQECEDALEAEKRNRGIRLRGPRTTGGAQ